VARPRGRIFCFHHAGGVPAAFAAWSELVPSDVEVSVLHYPREASNEVDGERIIEIAAADIARDPNVPCVLAGHSVGAFFAWRVAATLFERNVRVQGLTISSSGPWSARRVEDLLRDEPAPQLLARLSGDPASGRSVSKSLTDAFVSDLRLANAVRTEVGPIPVPIQAFIGDDDPVVPASDLAGWREVTTATLTIETLPGHHFYLFETAASRRIVKAMMRQLGVGPRSERPPRTVESVPAE
jgi:pyochelin biosynthetic protein PchC